MKVKIIETFTTTDLEEVVNKFLDSINGEIIDIKFSSHVDASDTTSLNHYYSALIMYITK